MTPQKEIIFFINNQFQRIGKNKEILLINKQDFSLDNEPGSAKLYVESKSFSLVPTEIFKQIKPVINNRFTNIDEDTRVFTNSLIPNLESHVYWALEKNLKEIFTKKLPGCSLHHISEALIFQNSNNNAHKLKYLLGDDYIYITGINNGQLQLINRFPIINESDDPLYFILNVIKESNLIDSDFSFENFGKRNLELERKLAEIFPKNPFLNPNNNTLFDMLQ